MDTFNPDQMPPIPTETNKKSISPLIAVVVILALIIIGGLYFLKERSTQEVYMPPVEQSDVIADSLKQQGASDEIDSIEADLNATGLDNLDQGATAIEAELQ